MPTPADTWEGAAFDAAFAAYYEPYQQCVSMTDENIEGHLDLIAREVKGEDTYWQLVLEAALCVQYTPLDDLVALLASKQHDYGHGNILAFGEQGVKVRAFDKVARIRNLRKRGITTAANESYADSWRDLCGYAVIALMLQNDTFGLPLAADREEVA